MSTVKLSEAMAKRLAHLWVSGQAPTQSREGYQEPTITALIKRGILVPNGDSGTYPSGAEYLAYKLSDDALDHLAAYLLALRYKRVARMTRPAALTPQGENEG